MSSNREIWLDWLRVTACFLVWSAVYALIWGEPVQILATAILSFTASAIFCILVQKIPKAGRWIAG